MADGVAITAGSGTTVATDETGSGHAQLVKLAIATDGSATLIPADANGILVKGGGTAGTAASAVQTIQGIASMTPVQVGDNSGSLTVDAPVGTPAFVRLSDGSAAITTLPVSIATAPALVASSANIGDVDVLTVPENAGAAASTINSTSSDGGTALTNSAQAIKAGAGKLLGYYIYNPNTVACFVQVYNTASGSVTVGTTNPLFMLTVPALSAANLWMQPGGITFGTAMSWSAVMTTAGGNTAPTTALDAVAWYV